AEAVEEARDAGDSGSLDPVVRRDVELRPVPEHVRTARRPDIEGGARVVPDLVHGVEPEDVEVLSDGVPHARPPDAVVEPELALGLRSGRDRLDSRAGRTHETDVAGGEGRQRRGWPELCRI